MKSVRATKEGRSQERRWPRFQGILPFDKVLLAPEIGEKLFALGHKCVRNADMNRLIMGMAMKWIGLALVSVARLSGG